jgi:hypothetical protein
MFETKKLVAKTIQMNIYKAMYICCYKELCANCVK